MTPRINLPNDEGFIFFVFFGDHPPPHVHVANANGKASIALGDEHTRPCLLRFSGMKRHEVKRAVRLVEAHQAALMKAWRDYNA